MLAVFDTEKEVVLVMEYANGGELFDHVNSSSSSNSACCSYISTGGLCEHEARKIFRQLVSAVHYLHKVMTHR
jgi:serine/threonine protein kinase